MSWVNRGNDIVWEPTPDTAQTQINLGNLGNLQRQEFQLDDIFRGLQSSSDDFYNRSRTASYLQMSEGMRQYFPDPRRDTATALNSTTTQTRQRQGYSQPLEQEIDKYLQTLNSLSSNLTSAYGGVQDTYGDLMKNLADAYRVQAAGAAGQQQTAALGSGLTPLEAASLGRTARLDVLRQMFPQLATLQTEQAQEGVKLQEALAGLQAQNYLPFMQGVFAPYYEGRAGTTQSTTTENMTEDKLARASLLSQLANQLLQNRTAQTGLQFARPVIHSGSGGGLSGMPQPQDMSDALAQQMLASIGGERPDDFDEDLEGSSSESSSE